MPKPPLCPGCGGELSGILALCPDCLKSPKHSWKAAVAAMKMEGGAEELVYKFKYRGRPDLARPLGSLMARALESSGLKPDIIVPTPLHWTRLLARGYNQAELLAGELSRRTGLPLVHALRRTRNTGHQARLARKERLENLKGAFSLADSTPCKNRSILLVDDVMTTGSTLASASEILQAAGVAEVYVIIAARRQRT